MASILCSTLTILRFISQQGSAIEIHPSVKLKIVQATLLVHWYSNNFVLRNAAKTKVVHFSSKFFNTDPIPSINIGAYTIQLESAVCDFWCRFRRNISTCQRKSTVSANRRPQRYIKLERVEITKINPPQKSLSTPL